MKKIISLFLVFSLLLLCAACSSTDTYEDYSEKPNTTVENENPSVEESDNYYENNEHDNLDNTDNNDSSNNGYTLDEAALKGGVYIKDGDTYYSFPLTYEINYKKDSISQLDYLGMSEDDTELIPTIDLSNGKKLVTFETIYSYEYATVQKQGYAFPISFSVGENGIYYASTGPVIECEGYQNTVELNGKPVTSMDDVSSLAKENNAYILNEELGSLYNFNKYGYDFLASDYEDIVFTGGYYSGTEFCEYEISLFAKYFFLSNNSEFNIIKTKNGYFELDTSNLGNGMYSISIAKGYNSPNKYIVNIVTA